MRSPLRASNKNKQKLKFQNESRIQDAKVKNSPEKLHNKCKEKLNRKGTFDITRSR